MIQIDSMKRFQLFDCVQKSAKRKKRKSQHSKEDEKKLFEVFSLLHFLLRLKSRLSFITFSTFLSFCNGSRFSFIQYMYLNSSLATEESQQFVVGGIVK